MLKYQTDLFIIAINIKETAIVSFTSVQNKSMLLLVSYNLGVLHEARNYTRWVRSS